MRAPFTVAVAEQPCLRTDSATRGPLRQLAPAQPTRRCNLAASAAFNESYAGFACSLCSS